MKKKLRNIMILVGFTCALVGFGQHQLNKNITFINMSEIDDFQTYFERMMELNGEGCNAGEVYGLAMKIYEECGMGTIEQNYTDAELAEFFSDEGNMYLLDFTLPMLEPYFFEEEIAEYVQDASVAFVEYCIDEYGMTKAYRLCMDDSEEGRAKLVELKNDWLKKIGVSATYEEYGKIAFTYNYSEGMEEYPYVLKEESANWYFSVVDVKEYGYITFVNEYEKSALVAEADFAEAREVLNEYLSQDVQSVDIFT